MAKKERFGKFVLLEELESSAWGGEYRAAKLSSGGLEKIVSLLRLGPALSGSPEVAKALMEQTKLAAQLQSPNVLKILGIGKVEGTYYISYEHVEGKSLRAIFQRCRQEGFPLSVDHALLIASKVCSALEYAHGRKIEGQGRFSHGLLTPANVIVSYEGELRVRGFGYWQAGVSSAGAVGEDDLRYLAPEQVAGSPLDTRADIYAVGSLLFEGLTGEPLFPAGRQGDAAGRLSQAKLQNPTGEDDALPRPIVDILARALATDPNDRYAEVQEMRKALDTLLFSGDFTPTTFNLAFFMHSLFRDDIERESKALKQEREASYFEYLQEEQSQAAPSPAPEAPSPTPAQPVIAQPPVPSAPPPAAAPPEAEQATAVMPAQPTPAPAFTPVPPPSTSAPTFTPVPSAATPAPRMPTPAPSQADGSVSDLISRLTPVPAAPRVAPTHTTGPILTHAEGKKGSGGRMGIILGLVAAVALVGGAAYYFLVMKPQSQAAAPATPDPKAQEIQRLQAEVARMKEQQEAAAQKAADEARQKLEEEARLQQKKVDQEAVRRAQAEAIRKANEEAERKQAELEAQQARLEAERKAEEEAAARKKAEEEAARRAAAATPPPTPVPTPTPPPPPQIFASDAPGVIPPTSRCPTPPYPRAARALRVEGTVGVFVTIDEKGQVASARALSGPQPLRDAAVEHIKTCKFRAGTKDGVPVKVNMLIGVAYKL